MTEPVLRFNPFDIPLRRKEKAVIFDIDGTLANCEHRRHFVEGPKKDWDAFYNACSEDIPIEGTAYLFTLLKDQLADRILFVTGRPERLRKVTTEWLIHNLRMGVWQPYLFMRPDDDYTPDDKLKEKIYKEQIEPLYDVRFVLDDRDKVVKMWRRLGLQCLQVAEGNF